MSNDFALLDPLLAHGSFTLFAVMAVLAIRDLRQLRQGWLLILVLLSQMALTATRFPDLPLLPVPLVFAAKLAGLANLGLLWWFCLSLLRDQFRIAAFEWAGLLVLSVVPSVYLAEYLGFDVRYGAAIATVGDIPPVAMVVHVAWVAMSERDGDLIEPRRQVRLWLALAPLAALLISLITETTTARYGSVVRNGLAILPAQLLLLFWLARLRPEGLVFAPAPTPELQPRALQIASRDLALHARLMRAMEEEHIYLRHGLSIDALAATLGAPPHQLRQLINAGMGFRNFASFLNAYRLVHGKSALADVSRARDTVQAIAYEAGFASLPSFNRVFRQVVGQTPTGFRSATLVHFAHN